MHRVWSIISTYSLLLVSGAVAALLWANVAPESYHHFVEFPLWTGGPFGALGGDGTRVLTLHYLVNDMLMAFFFALAAKEVWEAVILKNGSLRGKKAMTPLIATLGGMTGPVIVYLAIAVLAGVFGEISHGWAVPTATDIAFSYLVARIVFGPGHPAIGFLLLLAIADDAGGLVILATFYPSAPLAPGWLALSLAAAVGVYLLCNWLPRRRDQGLSAQPHSTWMRRVFGVWPYAIAGAISWYGFQQAGIHPALGLLPIVPAIPHAEQDFGVFAEDECRQTDLLNRIEHAIKVPVEWVLLVFGLMNAGVEFGAIGAPTVAVLGGLMIGKPLGIVLFGLFAARVLRLGLPEGMETRDLLVVGCIAAIGFTVALFVAAVAFAPGPLQDAAKMGALLSLLSSIIAISVGRLVGVRRHDGTTRL